MSFCERVHGGSDATGAAEWDFSINANACGPCPTALKAVCSANASRYPDPSYQELRAALAALHGVDAWRVLPLASASEGIMRLTFVRALRTLSMHARCARFVCTYAMRARSISPVGGA